MNIKYALSTPIKAKILEKYENNEGTKNNFYEKY